MSSPRHITSGPSTDRSAAVRHAVYRDLLDLLPVASYDQAVACIGNLCLRREGGDTVDQQIPGDALTRFARLCVTPDIAETRFRGATQPEIERWLSARYGDQLAMIAGFYRRVLIAPAAAASDPGPWRLNLPAGCAMYGYRSPRGLYAGVLCQPLNETGRFFLLSSAKFGGAKAIALTPHDRQYFTQYEEVSQSRAA